MYLFDIKLFTCTKNEAFEKINPHEIFNLI